MQAIEISTDKANIRVISIGENSREWLTRHALHQLVKQYRTEFGDEATGSLLNELDGYHRHRVVGVR